MHATRAEREREAASAGAMIATSKAHAARQASSSMQVNAAKLVVFFAIGVLAIHQVR